ncbi:hypothetical protein Ae201684P_004663 [Aphanomyces euteiches]|uniref:DDE Tnp4 domain-containing protein n=1 Tax=Aphanomyces euteiches TaxID=100861 RepID=A0A6G0XDC7_9STRA|nr:hypothetical protein Ae201684_006185 [Aphanomyces euteiches]KAH9068966.1 hypothetical protein Ae201684P_004663 [Aphanomyces euteiches]KAH9145836.1 hypothetical protein AeRB84_010230 [Aphanomyces euteiches]
MQDDEELALKLKLLRRIPLRRRLYFLQVTEAALERPIIPEARISLRQMSNADAVLSFRFDVSGILQLVSLLRVPHTAITQAGDRCLGEEALAIVLQRLAYPKRFYDMVSSFGRSRESLCRIFNWTIDFLYNVSKETIYFAQHIVQDRLATYAEAIRKKGAALDNVLGFIDGSKIRTCRITQKASRPQSARPDKPNMQRLIYSGHKRMHCLNYQGVTTPDGLCAHFWGPIEGARHDTTLRMEQMHQNLNLSSDVVSSCLEDFAVLKNAAQELHDAAAELIRRIDTGIETIKTKRRVIGAFSVDVHPNNEAWTENVIRSIPNLDDTEHTDE